MDTIVWFVLLVVFIWAEASTVTMVSAWFALGALAAVITALLGGEIWLQVVVFLLISGVSLALLRPIAKKYFTPRITRTNVDAMTGKVCPVVADIDNLTAVGQVKLGGIHIPRSVGKVVCLVYMKGIAPSFTVEIPYQINTRVKGVVIVAYYDFTELGQIE